MTARPCLICGQPAYGPRCPIHQRLWEKARNQRRTQYAGPWQRLSKAARKAQPACGLCGTPYDLTLDHEHRQVECRRCNSSHRRNPQ